MNTKTLERQLKALTGLFKATKTPYAIIGGMAVVLYGEPRLTMDIDVNVILAHADLDFFLNAAKEFGFLPECPRPKSFAKKTGVIPMKFMRTKPPGFCDVIIAENPIEYSALKRSRMRKIGVLKAKFITAEDLLIHKIASDRPRDLQDAQGILARQRGKLDSFYILSWLKKIDKANKGASLVALFKSLMHSNHRK